MKGFFTQSAIVLLDRVPKLGALESQLKDWEIAKRTEAVAERSWMGGYPSLLVAMRPEVNGYVSVDIVDQSWPDSMGDKEAAPELFGAWATGWFGPFIFPGNLERALTYKEEFVDRDAALAHRAFVRVKSSYALGARNPDAPLLPGDYDALDELEFVTAIANALLDLPGALYYFNPNGETLHTKDSLESSFSYHHSQGILPLDVWSNVRLFQLSNTDGWTMMDTVGMQQLDVVDHEACFRSGSFDPSEVANFLRNATSYVHDNGPIVQDGDTMNGPGDRDWQARSCEEGIAPAPREVLRWLPVDGSSPPAALL